MNEKKCSTWEESHKRYRKYCDLLQKFDDALISSIVILFCFAGLTYGMIITSCPEKYAGIVMCIGLFFWLLLIIYAFVLDYQMDHLD